MKQTTTRQIGEIISAIEFKTKYALKPIKPNVLKRGDHCKNLMELVLRLSGMKYVAEHRFSTERKFRFDWYLPDHRIAIEYEGIFQGKAHSSIPALMRDIEKYNLAATMGITVLRYHARNFGDMMGDVLKVIALKQK